MKNKTPEIEVFAAFKNLPKGSIEAYNYHKRCSKRDCILVTLYLSCIPYWSYKFVMVCYSLIDSTNQATKYVTLATYLFGIMVWIWFVNDTLHSNAKHRIAMSEIIDNAHSGCFGGCYSLLEGRNYAIN